MEISVDTGNKQMKTLNETFTSGVYQSDVPPSTGKNADFMRFNGKYYILTEERGTYMRDKTKNDRYYWLTLFAIGKELERMEADGRIEYQKDKTYSLDLLVGLPPAHFGDLKNSFQKYFKRNGENVIFVYHGRSWNIRIQRAYVFAQGYAAAVTVFADIKVYPKALVIDIGGLTADYIMIRKGAADIHVSDSLESGVIILYQKIKKVCMGKFDTLIEESDVDAILQNREKVDEIYDPEIIKTVKEEARKFVSDFLGSFRELQIDLKTCYVIFIGGGAMLLREMIEESDLIKKHMFIEDVNANAKGYELLYRAIKASKK